MSPKTAIVVGGSAALNLGIAMVRKLKRKVDEVAAREQMMEFLALYTRGIDRLDPEILKMPFTEDATMDVPNLDRLEPIAAFAVGATGFLRATLVCSMHNVTNLHVVFSKNFQCAKSECYFIAHHLKNVDGKIVNATVLGRYCDTWVNKHGTFYIKTRKLLYDFQEASWNKTVAAAQTDDNVKAKPIQARKSHMGTRDKSDFMYDHIFTDLK